ncbi:MAG: YceI family protein [Myxococcales bacterium]|nr:YceI family protein [Myxococcales bacterium]
MSTPSTEGTVQVFTFKEGLLSKVAHDLRLSLARFEISRDGDTVRGRFWPDTLTVDGAMRDGRLDADGLKPKDKRDIHQNMTRKVLQTDRNPVVELEATHAGGRLQGQLTLNGRRQPIACAVTEAGGRITGRVTLVPTRWGVQPFKALMGAIKLQDRVEVTFDLPA